MMELYRATSIVDKFIHNGNHYNGVKLHWFANRKFPLTAYKKVVVGFDGLSEKDKFFSKEFIKELLTKQEAVRLKQYLSTAHGWNVEISPYPLPIEGKCLGFRSHEVGGTTGFVKLNEEKNYKLPIQVWGYYDVEGLQSAGGFGDIRISARGFITGTRKRLADLVNRLRSNDNKAV